MTTTTMDRPVIRDTPTNTLPKPADGGTSKGLKNSGDRLLFTCTPNPDSSILPKKVIAQKEDAWCWAACGQMVMHILQCVQANKQLNMDTCCHQPRHTCDQGGRFKPGLYGFDADSTLDGQAISWEEIKNQIDCQRKLICASWRYTFDDVPCSDRDIDPDTSGHLIVISGYKIDNGDSLVKILDPDPKGIGSTYTQRYSEFICGHGYAHWKDFYNVRKRHP